MTNFSVRNLIYRLDIHYPLTGQKYHELCQRSDPQVALLQAERLLWSSLAAVALVEYAVMQ